MRASQTTVGVDPAHTRRGGGLQDIRGRIEGLGGTFNLAPTPDHVVRLDHVAVVGGGG